VIFVSNNAVTPAPVFVAPVGGLKAGDAAQVGVQSLPEDWMPAFAGMTTFLGGW
jgi:hypothetical protein